MILYSSVFCESDFKILSSCTDFFVNYEIIRLFLVVSVFEKSNTTKEKFYFCTLIVFILYF